MDFFCFQLGRGLKWLLETPERAFVAEQNSYSLFLVLLSVNQSSDKGRKREQQQQQLTPLGAKKWDFSLAVSPLSFLLLPPWLQPLSLLSKPTPVSVSEALQRWKGICNAPPLTELCSVIRGKFTGLVWILNTLSTPVQPAVEKKKPLVVSVRCLVRPENINALMRLISFTVLLIQPTGGDSLGHTG